MTTITRENFTQAMRDSVAERGEDYVYRNDPRFGGSECVYSAHGKPACLIGVAIYKLTGDLVDPDAGSASGVMIDNYGVDDMSLCFAADRAQLAQDTGETWGDALKKYLLELGEDK